MKIALAALMLFVFSASPAWAGAAAVTSSRGTVSANPAPRFVVQTDIKVRRFYGYARALGSGKYLYTEVHARYLQGGRWVGGAVSYFAPDGTRIAHKVLDFPGDSNIPLYRMDQKNVHYAEGVSRVTAAKVYLFRQDPGAAAPVQTTVERRADMVVGVAGLERFIRGHLAELLKTGSMVFPLASARRMDVRRFSVTRLKDGHVRGVKAVRFKVESASLLRVFYGKPVFLSLDPATGRVLEYRGPSEVENPQTRKPWQVRVDYGDRAPAGAPAELPPLDPGDAD